MCIGVWQAPLVSIVRVTRIGGKNSIFARTCCTRGACVGTLLLLLLPWRSYGPASAHATIDVLLFLFSGLQDLGVKNSLVFFFYWHGTAKGYRHRQLRDLRLSLGVPYLERTQQALVNAHHSACVVKLPAVVGCAE